MTVVGAFFGGEEVQSGADEVPEGVDGSGLGLPQQFFEFREGHLDRIEIWTTDSFKNLLARKLIPHLQGEEAYENVFIVRNRWPPSRRYVVENHPLVDILPRRDFRALALFGRRPPEHAERPVIPASENLNTCRRSITAKLMSNKSQ